MLDLSFLKTVSQFAQDNYDPWKVLPVDDIALWFLRSYREGTLIPFLVGAGDQAELLVVFEFWQITPVYLKKLRKATGGDMPLPESADREGEILFSPVTIINQKYLGKGFSLARILQAKFMAEYPKSDGVYRWVLKDQRCRFMPFRRD